MCIWQAKKQLYSGNGPFPDFFGSVSNKDLFLKAQEMPLSLSQFLIAIVHISWEELEIKHRMREALEINYVYSNLARALIDAKENCKKKENNQKEGNSQEEYQKRTSLEMEIRHTWN